MTVACGSTRHVVTAPSSNFLDTPQQQAAIRRAFVGALYAQQSGSGVQPGPRPFNPIFAGTFYPDGTCWDSANKDTCLQRDGAADTLGQYRGTNGQIFRLYKTRTDASNYRRFEIDYSGADVNLRQANAGTGTASDVYLTAGSTLYLRGNAGATVGVKLDAVGLKGIQGTETVTSFASVTVAMYNATASSVLSVASNVIAPTNAIHHVGAGLIKTITVPASCTPTCTVDFVPDAAYTYDNTGNITVAAGSGTAVINRTMRATWDGTKWNMSY